jgi:uncharacterized repeat protein (TIGR03803 family)
LGGSATNCSNNGCGTVYKLTPTGSGYVETVLHRFVGNKGGAQPLAGLILDAKGALYGTAYRGGGKGCSDGCGLVFKLTPEHGGKTYTYVVLYSFVGLPGSGKPVSPLVADANGNLYLMNQVGGGGHCYGGCGGVVKLTPSNSGYTASVVYAFQGGSDGASPYNNVLSLNSDGSFYAMTRLGGSASVFTCTGGCGTALLLTPSGGGYTDTVLYAFGQTCSDGLWPQGGLYADASGNLFGTTQYGGSASECNGIGNGNVFELTPNGGTYTESIIHEFGGDPDGAAPNASLVPDGEGNLFGTTAAGGDGGPVGWGTVYELTNAGLGFSESVAYSFGQYQGDAEIPSGPLLLGSDGAFYGTTSSGGSLGWGTVYKLTH